MKITYNKAAKISIAISYIVNKDEKGRDINDKLSWAMKRFSDKNERTIKSINDSELDLMREYASVDDKGNFIVDEKGNLKFTKDTQKKLNAELAKLRENNTCEIDPHVCRDLTRSITLPLWVQVDLDGIVLTLDPEIKKFEEDDDKAE